MRRIPAAALSSVRPILVTLAVVAIGAGVFATVMRAGDAGVTLPAPAVDPAPTTAGPQTAVLAGGCFWGIQGVFQHVKGVTQVISGYAGGAKVNPTYDDVSTETTGHAETVKITYDPATVSYGTLLQVFFSVGHDPTQLNRQGPDTGTSYRSNIFYTTDAQKTVADAYIAQLTKAAAFPRKIVTRVDKFAAFYPAEDYHQDFLILHPTYPYIVINDLPKIANFKKLLPALYSETPVTVSAKTPKR
ncbi:MAG: peptide-methionine (S)-S-oxide reductase MsrA [Acidobacteriota bacterium]